MFCTPLHLINCSALWDYMSTLENLNKAYCTWCEYFEIVHFIIIRVNDGHIPHFLFFKVTQVSNPGHVHLFVPALTHTHTSSREGLLSS